MSVPKVERLLDLIAELLHARRPITAEEIRERLPGYPEEKASFQRAFERDKRDLREMGVPIRVEPLPGRDPPEEGYRIRQEEYYLPDPGLDPDERAALHLAATAVRLGGADAGSGLRKLGAGGPDADPVAFLPDAPHLALAFDAVTARRRLRFLYNDKPRVVDPFRLHHEKGRWYLQGYDLDADDVRSFRLDRVAGDVDADDPGTVQVDPDPAEHRLELDGWALGDDDPVEARVRIGPSQARVAVRMVGDDVGVTWEDDGAAVLTFPVRRIDGFRSFVLGFLDDAEVLGPPELRDDLVRWLRALTGAGAA